MSTATQAAAPATVHKLEPKNAEPKADMKTTTPNTKPTYEELALNEIVLGANVRSDLSLASKDGQNLVESVRRHGVYEPCIVVRGPDGKNVLTAGFRRYAAMKQARGINALLPCIVHASMEAKQRDVVQIVENVQRENLNPIDEARGYQALRDTHGMDQTEIAKETGMSPGRVSQLLSLLDLPAGIQKDISAGRLPFTSARHLTALAGGLKKTGADPVKVEKAVTEVAGEISDKGLAPAKVEDLVKARVRRAKEDAEAKVVAEKEKAKREAKVTGKPPPKEKVAEPADYKTEVRESVKNLKIKVPGEKRIRDLLREYADKFLAARTPESRKEYNDIFRGIALAAGQDLKLPDPK